MNHLRLFPTNVGVFDIKDADTLNKDLEQMSFLFNGSYKWIRRKNVWDLGGEFPVINQLKNIILDSVVQYAQNYYNHEYKQDYFQTSESWVESSRPGEDNLFAHNHRLTHVACAYYVSVDDNTGDLDFVDPRGSLGFISLNNQQTYNIFRFKPKVGQLLVFPGWMTHFVHPNRGNVVRKVIATNVNLREDVQFVEEGSQIVPNISSLKI